MDKIPSSLSGCYKNEKKEKNSVPKTSKNSGGGLPSGIYTFTNPLCLRVKRSVKNNVYLPYVSSEVTLATWEKLM